MIIYGSTTYGATDAIPGVGEVVTRFSHIYFFPMVPRGSFFQTKQANMFGNGGQAARVRFSWKSTGLAYFRAFLGTPAIGAAVGCLVLFGAGNTPRALALLGFAVTFGLLVGLSYLPRFRRASRKRAEILLAEIGVPPGDRAHLLEGLAD